MKELLIKYINNECTTEEVHQLLNFFGINNHKEEELRQVISDYFEHSDEDLHENHPAIQSAIESAYKKIEQRLHAEQLQQQSQVVPLRRRYFSRIAAAAIVVLAIGAGAYFFTNMQHSKQVSQITPAISASADVFPGGDKAVLTLADGSVITLDSAAEGMVAKQGSANIFKQANGKLVYNAGTPSSAPIQYNTVSTPVAGQYQVNLSDGSKVWLNAASSLRFPTVFSGNNRVVEITGEAYFEVAKNATKPFYVKVDNIEVKVLGTAFNVDAYKDQQEIKTTLLEGSVMLDKNARSKLLIPGQQAITSGGNDDIKLKEVDIDRVVAWKNGLFKFSGDDIDNVMQQISRWYDVEILYAGKKPTGHFSGVISRNMPLSKVLYMLEANDVNFQINGKQITVHSK